MNSVIPIVGNFSVEVEKKIKFQLYTGKLPVQEVQ